MFLYYIHLCLHDKLQDNMPTGLLGTGPSLRIPDGHLHGLQEHSGPMLLLTLVLEKIYIFMYNK